MAARVFYPKNRTGIIHGAVCRRRITGHLRSRTVSGYLDAEVQKEGTVFRVTYAAAQPEPKPQPEAGEAPETGKRGWLAAPALILIAAAGIFLRNLRKKSKKA